MSEAEESPVIQAPEGADKPKKKLDPGFRRNLKVIGIGMGALAVVVLAALMLKGGSKADQSKASRVELGAANTQEAAVPTPALQQMLEEQQKAEAKAAAKQGQSYIPPDTVGEVQPVQPEVVHSAPQFNSTYAQSAQYANAQPTESDRRRREGLERQLEALLAANNPADAGAVRQRVVPEEKGNARQTSATADIPANGVAVIDGGRASSANAPAIIKGLTIHAAELSNDMVVPADRAVYASATVNAGPAKGAFLIGQARVVGENLEISFNQMRLGDKMYRVDAVVLDEVTAGNAIAGKVDSKILERYVMPITLAIAQGFYKAKSAVGAQVVGVGDSTAIVTPPSTTSQARSAGIAEGLDIAKQEVQKQANEPITVSAPKRTAVGILFRQPVTEEAK